MSDLDKAVELIDSLLQRGRGAGLETNEEKLLRQSTDEIAEYEDQIRELMHRTFDGFLDAAAEGHAFTDPSRIQRRFGLSLEENYPEAGDTFLPFAQSYWTFKFVVDDLPEEARSTGASNVLTEVEHVLRVLFFPAYGPAKIDPDKRERDQRKMLARCDKIDTDQFMAENPILIRDRQELAPGCLWSWLGWRG